MKLNDLIQKLPAAEQEKLLSQVMTYKSALERERCQAKFMNYVKKMWPGFIGGRHHALMGQKFEEIAEGKLKRLIINMAPRHTKSEFASYLLPSWYLGKYPKRKVIQSSNTADLAVNFGRKVRNLVLSEQYAEVFPNVSLRQDSKAAGRWATNHDGEYFAIGVGGTVTGKGADLLIIDDPHSEQEATLGDPTVFDKVFEWYTSGPRQRLQPGGTIVVVMCMTGDTPVLMADGTKKPLAKIKKDDLVATFDNGKLSTSKVNNWRSSGVDAIYKIQTQSGKILRANKRHPFLVMNEGVLEWTRLEQLRPRDLLVSLKGVEGHRGQKQNQACAGHADQKKAITVETLMHRVGNLVTTGNGRAKHALKKVATNLFIVLDCAATTTQKNIETLVKDVEILKQTEPPGLNLGTGLLRINMMRWLQNVGTNVMSAASLLQHQTHARIGTGSCALTTATIPEKSVDYYVTTAILQSGTERNQAYLNELHRISDFTADPIISIDYDGLEEVFDVEIDRTENFIANGVVSHNTRWSDRDLTGKIIREAAKREKHEEWEVIELPAIMPSGNPLWPEFWSLKELEALKEELPPAKWNAQYQQQPTGEEGAIIKREWWQMWEKEDPPPCEFIIQSWDTAFTKSERADYSACTTWGVFYKDEDKRDANIIMLDAFQKRMEFPELKDKALSQYKYWEPDACIIEAKAAGAPLVFELRQMGVPVSEYTPVRGNDKFVRINSVSDLFRSGKVWRPDTRWADEVADQMAAFPNAEHDDLVDSSVQALIRFRQGGFLRLASDEEDEPQTFRRKAYY